MVPTYKRPTTIDRAIHTVQAQTFTDWELIIVDDNDASHPDRQRTHDRLAARGFDSRVRTILHASNRGGAAARNTGIRAARGSWIAFLDDDDEWDPTKLERQLAAAEVSGDDVALVYCGVRVHHIATGRVQVYRSKPGSLTVRDLLERNHIGTTSCVMVRADALRKVGMFDEDLASRQDIDLYVRLAGSYRFEFVDIPLVTMHLHRGGRIGNRVSAQVKGHRRFLEKHRHQIESDRGVHRTRLKDLGRHLLAANEFREARQVLSHAWRLDVRDHDVFKWLLMTYPTVRSLNRLLRPRRATCSEIGGHGALRRQRRGAEAR